MKIGDLSKISNVTVRTLRHYDKLGLLKPTKTTQSKYRIYDESSLNTLQEILFFKEMDFSLKEIKEIMSSPNYTRQGALTSQKEMLITKRNRLNKIINLIDRTINKGGNMSFKEFSNQEIETTKAKYDNEIRERYSHTKEYKQYSKKKYTKEELALIEEKGNEILNGFAKLMNKDPKEEIVQKQVRLWQEHISQYFYTCSKEMLLNLSIMYKEDERFKNNMNRFKEGNTDFIVKAIEYYCKS